MQSLCWMLVLTVTRCQPFSQRDIFTTNQYFISSQCKNILPTCSHPAAYTISIDFPGVAKGTSVRRSDSDLRSRSRIPNILPARKTASVARTWTDFVSPIWMILYDKTMYFNQNQVVLCLLLSSKHYTWRGWTEIWFLESPYQQWHHSLE